MDWHDAVVRALERYSARHGTRTIDRQSLVREELEQIAADTDPVGATPEQTLRRVLQELREQKLLIFSRPEEYVLLDGMKPSEPRNSGRVFGEISGFPPGSLFQDRTDLAAAGVHRPLQAGISGAAQEGADSIVLSGGYEDDVDEGSTIVYTGHGGNDPASGKQIADQQLTRGNQALAKNVAEGLPVRVIRGVTHPSPYSPSAGYRYDGLFRVESFWHEVGKSGFRIWRFRLRQLEGETSQPASPLPPGVQQPTRQTVTVQRVVRNSAVGTKVKALHDYCCQVCGLRLATPAGPYAEAAHIRPLGKPHNGPDTPDNILCLCANHHVLFDLGAFTIADDFTLLGLPGSLRTTTGHRISVEHVTYHRHHHG